MPRKEESDMERYFSVNAAGRSIRCKLYCTSPNAIRQVVIYGHGFGGNKDTKIAQRFAGRLLSKHKDAALLTFDWPCHGQDVGKTLLLEDCDLYLDQVLDYVQKRWKPQLLLGYGTSFGGFLFLRHLAQKGCPFHRLALRCPALTIREALTNSLVSPKDQAKLAAGKPVLVGFDRKFRLTRSFLEQLEAADVRKLDFRPYAGQILILHGTRDELIPLSASEEFAGRNGISFLPIEGADHGFMDLKKLEEATKAIMDFYYSDNPTGGI